MSCVTFKGGQALHTRRVWFNYGSTALTPGLPLCWESNGVTAANGPAVVVPATASLNNFAGFYTGEEGASIAEDGWITINTGADGVPINVPVPASTVDGDSLSMTNGATALTRNATTPEGDVDAAGFVGFAITDRASDGTSYVRVVR